MRILMVYPRFPDTFWSFQYALDFIDKKASSPPLGLVTVAAMLPQEWEKRLVDMNVSPLRDADLQWADMVFLSAMAIQRKSVEKVIERCNRLAVPVVAGGPLFTEEHESFEGVSHFVLNEAELTLEPFLQDLEQGRPQKVYRTDQFAEMSRSPVPQWELVDLDKYDSLSIQFSRGCPFNCEFCSVTALLGHKVRTKTAEQIMAELDKMYSLGWRRNIFFVDDNFIGNRKLVKREILPALIVWREGKSGCRFITEASINLSDDAELMEMMVQAGFQSVFVGIETPDEHSLEECHKTQNRGRDLVESVKRLQRVGLQVMGGFIVGFDSDTESIFQRQIDFIQNSGIVTAMVGLLQAPYGTQLYQRLKEEGRLVGRMSGDNVDGETNIIPSIDLRRLKEGYRYILEKIYQPEPFYRRVRTFLQEYNNRDFHAVIEWPEIKALFRTIIRLGIFGRERREYWKLLFWTLWHFPDKLPQAVTFSVYGYHFRTMMERHVVPAG